MTDRTVTAIINTHTHADHTDSNAEFSRSIEFVAHENTRASLSKDVGEPLANCGFLSGEKANYLPKKTFHGRMSIQNQ